MVLCLSFFRLSTEPKLIGRSVVLSPWTQIYLMSWLMLIWTLMRVQSHSLPLREVEGVVAGDVVAGAGEEVSYHIIFHK